MGSLNNGQPVSQSHLAVRHAGHEVGVADTSTDSQTNSHAATGVIRFTGTNTIGVVYGGDGTQDVYTSGVARERRDVSNSVEREKFTDTSSSTGNLQWHHTRKISGIHTSVTELLANSSLGPSVPNTERKIFFTDKDRGRTSGFDAWTIYDTTGEAVGASTGTTDTDITPSGTWDERPSFDG